MRTGDALGPVSANVLPCLPPTGAWHAPVIAPREELSSGSSAALHGGQDIPALLAPSVPQLVRSYTANKAAVSAWHPAFAPNLAGYLCQNRPRRSGGKAPDRRTAHRGSVRFSFASFPFRQVPNLGTCDIVRNGSDDCDDYYGGIVLTVATVATVAPRFTVTLLRAARSM